jgi:NitT/TauT family transport system substrate-binding protein
MTATSWSQRDLLGQADISRKEIIVRNSIAITLAVLSLSWAAPRFTTAAEIVNVAVPDRGAWDTCYTELGVQKGFFKERGLDVHIIHVANETELEQALISGTVDVAVAAGFPDILAAWVKGAPIRIISPQATGAPDIFWFARIGGPVASMKDLHGGTVGFSTPGSLSNFILLKLLQEAGVDDARLVPIGAADNGYPLVLNARLDASWSAAPVANIVRYILAGEIRVIARGNDSPQVRNETVRVNAVNADFLAAHRSTVLGFLRAYKKSVDWAYSGQPAFEAYAKLSGQELELVKYTVTQFASKETAQLDEIKTEDRALATALAAKLIPHALTRKDIKGVYDLVLKQGS